MGSVYLSFCSFQTLELGIFGLLVVGTTISVEAVNCGRLLRVVVQMKERGFLLFLFGVLRFLLVFDIPSRRMCVCVIVTCLLPELT